MNDQDESIEEIPIDPSVESHLSPFQTRPIVVGIGASAGGLGAFEAFFGRVSPLSGMAYVVIQHLDPHHHSILPALLQRYTTIPVILAENDMPVVANSIYVIRENVMLAIFHGRFQLLGPTAGLKIRLSVDYFFRSLARDSLDQAVAIVLSGTGSDGSLGLKAIKEAGGLVMVQDPTTTVFDGMPRSAIATGLVDFILYPEAMPERLVKYWSQLPDLLPSSIVIQRPKSMSDPFQHILLLIRTQTGHDFSHYKQTTISRRIDRLMVINNIHSLDEYVTFLLNNTIGVEVLFRDLLIGVTNFFRDKDIFESLKTTVIPHLFHNRQADQTIRIWVAGCSTGEEVYSIAILLQEHMRALKQQFRIQIFATDIDVYAVNTARLGAYSSNIEIDVPEEYLRQYFTATTNGYQVVKSLREMIVFAPHSVTKDPPFSKLDFISCRNVLIYMDTELQNKVLSYFHFALIPMAFLLLGSSESLGLHEPEFTAIAAQHKIFQRTQGASAARFKPVMPTLMNTLEQGDTPISHPRSSKSIRAMTENRLLTHWTPTCIVVNHQGHMRYVHGSSRHYLDVSGELDQLDIIRAARESLKMPLKSAIYRAIIQQRAVYEMNVPLETDLGKWTVNLIVEPFSETPTNEALLAIYFEEVKNFKLGDNDDEGNEVTASEGNGQQYLLLQQELNDTRAYLQATIEELKSANEEMQSINEELQSLNEELETSQEELKAVNEELMTTNTELESKVEEVTWAHNDLGNTLNTLQAGIILLDEDLHIRRFNPVATQGFKLIATDIGRSIEDIVSEFIYPTFLEDAKKVFNFLTPYEADIQSRDGRWYALQIRPYRTLQNAIKGVVILFNDVTMRKQMEESHQEARLTAENILNMMSEPFLILNTNLQVVNASAVFLQTFHLTVEDTLGHHFKHVGQGQWKNPELIALIEDVFKSNTTIQAYDLVNEIPGRGPKKMRLSVRQIISNQNQPLMILVAIKDVSDFS